jgi:hypothetical protein
LRLIKCVVPGSGRGPLPSEGKGHTFESLRGAPNSLCFAGSMRIPTPKPQL